ncbi:Tigger transposable element-derived protein 4 [Araneus ventricosus]|uniref:Tigger transposable element-derived protein 4 n=1 Tax=Araneus ventricosus TaxID=182803 RepID=A0A4Y2BIP7_ARAVE|nr:Tigger transposable element-derived protein 4 [Araneus ventricosus]
MCSVESNFSVVKIVSKRKLKVLNLSDKVNLILEVEKSPHIKKKILAKKYGIPPNTLSTILKNKTIILERYASNVNPKCKRLKACAFPQIESALITWCQTHRMEHGNIPISGIMLREKAMGLAKLMGAEEFKASSGWLEKFKARYKIALTSLNGEIKDTTEDSQTVQEETLIHILKNYDADNIFSIDESVLFYKYFQSKMVSEDISASEDTQNKDKLTIVVGANASGTEKLPLVVIGKAEIQLSSEDNKSLPVDYYANKMDWMTCDLFERYIRKLDHMFHSRDRRILLFVGNCRAHFEVPDLQAIKLETLPSNPSVMLQPSDKGIVQYLKHAYQEHLARMTIVGAEKGINNCIDVLQAIQILSRKWDNDVSQTMIINSFKIQGLLTNEQIYNNGKIPSVDELSVNEQESLNVSNSNYVDESLVITSGISNVNIVGTVKTQDNESTEDICVLVKSPSDTEVAIAISTIECYLRSRSNVNEELLQHLQKISDFVSTQKRKL